MECLVCKGTGKSTVTVFETNKPEAHFETDCYWCEGTGNMSVKQAKSYLDYKNIWCKCGNPSGNAVYFQKENGYHGWNCADCGKLLQEG